MENMALHKPLLVAGSFMRWGEQFSQPMTPLPKHVLPLFNSYWLWPQQTAPRTKIKPPNRGGKK